MNSWNDGEADHIAPTRREVCQGVLSEMIIRKNARVRPQHRISSPIGGEATQYVGRIRICQSREVETWTRSSGFQTKPFPAQNWLTTRRGINASSIR
jgi:hypothetical protein